MSSIAELEKLAYRRIEEAKAEKAMRKARTLLVLGKKPQTAFFARLVLKLELRVDWSIDTACTDGECLWYNPEFINRLPPEQVLGVNVHEVMHPAMNHHTRRRKRDPEGWNVACFVAGTQVSMADGTTKAIELIRAGDQVLGVRDGCIVPTAVRGVASKVADALVEVNSGCKTTTSTCEHLFLGAFGYVEAQLVGAITNQVWTFHGQGDGVHKSQPSLHDNGGAGDSSQEELRIDPTSHRTDWWTSGRDQTTEHIAIRANGQTDPCLYRRTGRWRGNAYGRKAKSQERSDLLSTDALHLQHQHNPRQEARELGIRPFVDKQHDGPRLLEDEHWWLVSDRRFAQARHLADRQAAALSTRQGVHSAAAISIASREAFGTDARNRIRTAGAQLAQATARRIEPRTPTVVYDIATEARSFIADGFVVHNCDLAINPIVCEAGYKLPDWICYPGRKPFENFPVGLSAEKYYEMLPKEYRQGGKPGQGDHEGGVGGVREPSQSSSKLRESEAKWEEAVVEASQAAKARGAVPAGMAKFVKSTLEPELRWEDELQDFLSHTLVNRDDYSWRKLNRRFMWQGLYLPSLASPSLGHIVVGLDTSGSMWQVLPLLAAELTGILSCNPCRVSIVYCDAKVQHSEEWTPADGQMVFDKFYGGGGTDHQPLWNWIKELDDEPACVVAITDMMTNYGTGPDVPVLWASTEKHYRPVPFGRVIHVKGPTQ